MLNTVMVIDDSDADLLFTRLILERSGAAGQVVAIESAREALQLLRGGGGGSTPPPDLILLDINMPGMNGFEFLQAYDPLRRDHPDAPVVVMLTSSPDPGDRERALAFGCVRGYVTKPITREAALGLEALLAAGTA